ncbi:MAG: hypothetical protein U0103_18705 [Candidatus Obscuribacterales bacterium]|nr:MAG: hypothetical protein EKK48_25320 [Candidatus Melainabacteria bacterium]
MTYPPQAELARDKAQVPASPNTSADRAFRDEIEKESPVNSLDKTKSKIDALHNWDGSADTDSPVVRIVDKDGTLKTHDDAGNLTTVEFYDSPGKRHQYGYNDKNQLISVDRSDKVTGEEIHLRRNERSDKWYLEKEGARYYLPGKVDLKANGDFAVQHKDGSWRVEDVHGNVVDEKRLASGAALQFNEDKSLNRLKRADGTRIDCTYDKDGKLETIKETKDKHSTTWTRNESGDFGRQGSDEVRKNLSIDQNGNLKYKSEDGLDHVIAGDGSHVVSAGDNKTKVTYDSEGRLSLFTKADGTARQFEYEGNTTRVSKFTELNAKGEISKTYERTKDDEWKCMQGDKSLGLWHGDLKTGLDGSWSMFSGDKKDNPNNLWRNVDAQERINYSRENPDGSKLFFDDKKLFSEIERADHTGIVWSKNGDSVRVSTVMPDGSQLRFDYDLKSRLWNCDDPSVKPSSEMPVKGNGELSFQRVDGTTVTVLTDSSTTIRAQDGSVLKYDVNQNLVARSKDNNVRTFQYKDGEIVGYSDRIQGKPEKQVDLSNEKRVELTARGDLIHVSADGKRQIETADFSHVECNDAGKPARITTLAGAVRDIEYNPATNEAVSISDTMVIGEKTVTRKWETGENWQGTFAVIGEKDGKLTQKFARHDVQIDELGNYSYLSGDGRKVVSKAGDGVRIADNGFISADVDEARTRYLDVMRDAFNDPARSQRLESMASAFETRMINSIERRSTLENPETVRAQVEQRIKATYDNLTRMVASDDPKTFDSKSVRVNFGETYMYHAMEPETVTQEGWGSCWLQSGYVPCGIGEHPDAVAKVLADVSLTGSYTDLQRNTYNFNSGNLAISNQYQGAGWTIENATGTSLPSPVAHRLDATMAAMDRGANYGRAGDVGRIRYGGGGQKEILRRVTGDELTVVNGYPSNRAQRAALLHAGGAQRDGGPNHVATWALRKERDQWLLIRGNQYNDNGRGDRVVAVIRDLKSWLDNGESAQINKRFFPGIGNDFKVVGDAIKPSDFRPNNRPDNDNPERRFAGRRRWFFRR